MSSSSMGKELPKEKKWGIRNCRERKCPQLRKDEDTAYPEEAQERCQVFHTMPGTLPCCIQDPAIPPDILLHAAGWHILPESQQDNYNKRTPGPKNCPATCPYKISEIGEVFGKAAEGYKKKQGTIWRCAFTGDKLGTGLSGTCLCCVLDSSNQEHQIEVLKDNITLRRDALFFPEWCSTIGCPDGVKRCGIGETTCPVIKLPLADLPVCPLWRIPAKTLPAPASPPAQEPACPPSPAPALACTEPCTELPTTEKALTPKKSEKHVGKEQAAAKKKKAKPDDPICIACRERNKDPVPEHACAWCKEEQEKRGRRAWVSTLNLDVVHLGDMQEMGQRIPDDSVDVIFTDPPYIKDLWERSYGELGELAARVLKPWGFLITYAPQAHLEDIMMTLSCSGDDSGQACILHYFWILSSLNSGQVAKDHQHNALCLHKPILVYQKQIEEGKVRGAKRCFADVVRGLRQKKFHPWQQSVHDVLGIISRFCSEGDILVDPFAGTGTSLKAANLLGLSWIGFEIDPKTHAIAVREVGQKPVALFTFGGDEPDPVQPREPVEGPKDTSKQASIEICKVVKTQRPSGAGTGGGPQPYIQHCCGTCGHHKGRKTFHPTCPRLGELLFKGGTKSAKVLMEETQRERCEHWIVKQSEEKSREEISDERHGKEATLKGFKRDTPEWFAALTASKRGSCPGWHWEVWKINPKKGEWLYEGAGTEKGAKELKKQLESDEFHKGSRFEVRKRPTVENLKKERETP